LYTFPVDSASGVARPFQQRIEIRRVLDARNGKKPVLGLATAIMVGLYQRGEHRYGQHGNSCSATSTLNTAYLNT
jgi:hypothetical protein